MNITNRLFPALINSQQFEQFTGIEMFFFTESAHSMNVLRNV